MRSATAAELGRENRERGALRSRERGGPRSRDRGSVTAEFATVVPAVVLVLACCLASVQLAGQQLQLQDAAADAARSLARGDSAGSALAHVSRAVPGVRIGQSSSGGLLCVTLSARSRVPLGTLLGVTLRARSCALAGGL